MNRTPDLIITGFLVAKPKSARSTFIATDGTPWRDEENREGKLVFIGRRLQKAAFGKMFKRHMM